MERLTRTRVRRVKCDEQHPCCQRCIRANRECGGYTQNTNTISQHAPRHLLPRCDSDTECWIISSKYPLMSPVVLTSQEWQGLEYFWHQPDFQLPDPALCTPPWETLAMQLTQSQPAIASAVAALGMVQLAQKNALGSRVVSTFAQLGGATATRQYIKAINLLQDLVKKVANDGSPTGMEAILVACLLLMSIDIIRDDTMQAAEHLKNGLKMLCCHFSNRDISNQTEKSLQLGPHSRSPMNILARLFASLECDFSMFVHSGHVYQHVLNNVVDAMRLNTLNPTPKSFSSLEEAGWHLTALSNAVAQTRSKLLRTAEVELRAKRGKVLSEDNLYNLTAAESRILDLMPYSELIAEMRCSEWRVESWHTRLCSMPSSSDESWTTTFNTLQIQYFIVSICRFPVSSQEPDC